MLTKYMHMLKQKPNHSQVNALAAPTYRAASAHFSVLYIALAASLKALQGFLPHSRLGIRVLFYTRPPPALPGLYLLPLYVAEWKGGGGRQLSQAPSSAKKTDLLKQSPAVSRAASR